MTDSWVKSAYLVSIWAKPKPAFEMQKSQNQFILLPPLPQVLCLLSFWWDLFQIAMRIPTVCSVWVLDVWLYGDPLKSCPNLAFETILMGHLSLIIRPEIDGHFIVTKVGVLYSWKAQVDFIVSKGLCSHKKFINTCVVVKKEVPI